MNTLLVRDVEVAGRPGVDVLIRAGVIVAIGSGLDVPGTAEVLDGRGGALIPGLHDHHLHLHAAAAQRMSVQCGPPHVRSADDLTDALAAAPGDDWIRGVGYIESVAGLLDSAGLDRIHATRPVRIQHRSGAMWVLNTAAAARVRLDNADHPGVERDERGRPTGRVWRADDWLRDRLPATAPPALDAVGADLTRFGITGITDATPDLSESSLDALVDAHLRGIVPQRMRLLGVPLHHESSWCTYSLSSGPYKIVLADSGLPELDDLVATIRRVHEAGRAIAAHCVTREALLILLVALDEAGTRPGDRIEHGALIPAETIEQLRRRGLTVVTQPGFLAHRGDDYLHDVEPRDLPDLYRCRSLIDGHVPTALSSDAPYGPLDPWEVIAAAVDRRCPTGEIVGPAERIDSSEALDRYLAPLDDPGGPARTIRVGAEADLVLLDRSLTEVLASPQADRVRATVIRGEVR
ncbi:amidohydrolase family protein [Rhodococcus sp. HM1]|uniref:amidohydrolase family protein n=1 Tax=Rhodococcus sp. HM1 TaxID=2937759 RepID=UPI00200AA094|nr:amidohydrolase family protein [Rhodococcus sp. HM1]MCK8673166.1 amidohydrolase family protein [Rhodococcus sp. HM1]